MSRLTEQEVNKQLDDSLLSFYNTPYTRVLPKGFIQIFKDAIFASEPIKHQIHVAKLRRIFAAKEEDLTTGEVGAMNNVILSTRLDWLYPDIDAALDIHEKLEELVIAYNEDVSLFKKTLENKRRTLMQLVSPNNRNGMKIISPTGQA